MRQQAVSQDPFDLLDTVGGLIGSAFACMEIAESEIAEARKRYPTKSEEINGAFGLLCTPEILQGKALQLYRMHAREVVTRIGEGLEPRVSNAMVLAALSEWSLEHMPNQDARAAMEQLYLEVFDEIPGGEILPTPEYTPGGAVQVIEGVRRRLSR